MTTRLRMVWTPLEPRSLERSHEVGWTKEKEEEEESEASSRGEKQQRRLEIAIDGLYARAGKRCSS